MTNQQLFKLIKDLKDYDVYLYDTIKRHEDTDSVGHAISYLTDTLINNLLGVKDYTKTWGTFKDKKGFLVDQAFDLAMEAPAYKDFKQGILDLEETFLSFN